MSPRQARTSWRERTRRVLMGLLASFRRASKRTRVQDRRISCSSQTRLSWSYSVGGSVARSQEARNEGKLICETACFVFLVARGRETSLVCSAPVPVLPRLRCLDVALT